MLLGDVELWVSQLRLLPLKPTQISKQLPRFIAQYLLNVYFLFRVNHFFDFLPMVINQWLWNKKKYIPQRIYAEKPFTFNKNTIVTRIPTRSISQIILVRARIHNTGLMRVLYGSACVAGRIVEFSPLPWPCYVFCESDVTELRRSVGRSWPTSQIAPGRRQRCHQRRWTRPERPFYIYYSRCVDVLISFLSCDRDANSWASPRWFWPKIDRLVVFCPPCHRRQEEEITLRVLMRVALSFACLFWVERVCCTHINIRAFALILYFMGNLMEIYYPCRVCYNFFGEVLFTSKEKLFEIEIKILQRKGCFCHLLTSLQRSLQISPLLTCTFLKLLNLLVLVRNLLVLVRNLVVLVRNLLVLVRKLLSA